MSSGQITASDIQNWDSLEDIAESFEKRGLVPHPDLGDDNRIVLELADGEFIELVEAGAGKSATDYKPGSVTRHTNLVSTADFETFTFITRVRDWDAHGRIKYQQFSFEKEQFRSDSGEKNTVLQKLNDIEYGKSAAVMDDLYDTRQIVKEFYEQFESLRTDLVEEVSGIDDDRGDAKERYVQVLLDRMIFLYFIQEKNLLDYDGEYLHNHHKRVMNQGGDVYEDFYDPLFFEMLAEGKNDPEFGKLPYLNGGLFSKNPIEEEFEDAKLGADTEETNKLFGRILDFLSDWNWNVDERLDIVDPKNLSPAVLGHIFEQTVNQKEMGAYYTPEEITGFMARRTIHPYLLTQLNEAVGTEYESIDDVFSLELAGAEGSEDEAIADGGTLAHEVNTDAVNQDHIETLYFDVLQDARVLDPAVGSGAFLLASQEVLLDVYLQCIEYFLEQHNEKPWELTGRIKDEIERISTSSGTETLYAKREIILNNLYGVDIDDGAVEICKLRLWLSMVADIEDEPSEVEPLPNIDFNIRSGDSLIGFNSTEVVVDGQKLLISELLKEDLQEYRERISEYKASVENISNLRGELESMHSDMQNQLNDWFSDLPTITVEDDVSEADEVRDIISKSNANIKLKLKFSHEIDEDLDEKLNKLGFRTWKKAANIELSNEDVLAGTPEEIFEQIPEERLARSFVERGLLKEDIESLDPFHWVMEFPGVYGNNSDGFDIVLENPPYVRIETIEELKRDLYKDLHETATGRCDLYVPFIERSYDLLSASGRVGIITSNQFMVTDYGESLRGYLPKNVGLYDLYDFNSYSAFDGVTIYSTILIGGVTPSDHIECVSIRSNEAVDHLLSNGFDNPNHDSIVEFDLPSEILDEGEWTILAEDERAARSKIESKCNQRLGDDKKRCTIGSPLKTGQDTTLRATLLSNDGDEYNIENNRINGVVESEIWKKMIIPDDVQRWVNPDPHDVIFFPYRDDSGDYKLIDGTDFKNKYPKTYEKLLEYKEELESRKDSRRTWKQLGRPWYSLAREGGPEYFERDKIVTDSIVDEPRFCIDTEGYLFASGGAATKGITPHDIDIYYLVGYLNSSAIYSYITPIAPQRVVDSYLLM